MPDCLVLGTLPSPCLLAALGAFAQLQYVLDVIMPLACLGEVSCGVCAPECMETSWFCIAKSHLLPHPLLASGITHPWHANHHLMLQ